MTQAPTISPLVSVIIPCYNHGQYLANAIDSVLAQTYTHFEIIVVDDGSTDNTKEVATGYSNVRNIYKENAGLSAARNTGIAESKGEYLLFLDADDWLYPDALTINVGYLNKQPQLAFVSGAHTKVYEATNTKVEENTPVNSHHYLHFLQGNYIGMHATVLYRRFVFDNFLYDDTLKVVEDYDLYLKIARKFEVAHHTHQIAAYRMHQTNMSGNMPQMLEGVLYVLQQQKKHLQTKEEQQAYKEGLRIWKWYYCTEMYQQIAATKAKPTATILKTLRKHQPKLYFKLLIKGLLKQRAIVK